jgi:N-acyl-D-amino-acid deacylase
MMDQSGEVLVKNGLAENKLRAGITTAIAGEGGAPVPSAELDGYFERLQARGSRSTSPPTMAQRRRALR